MSVGRESRYNYAAIMRVTDSAGFLVEREHLDIRPTLVNIVHADNREYVPSPNDNWSRIAWRKLGDGRRWWIIADYSQIVDPFTELRPVEKTKYVTQLAADIPATSSITEFQVNHPTKVNRGDMLRIEDLDIAHQVSMDVAVLSVNETAGTVQVSPVTSPAGGIPAALSRVSRIYKEQLRIIVPSAHRAFFEALNFGNPLNVLVE